MNTSKIYHHLKTVYGDVTDQCTANRWSIKFSVSEAGKTKIEGETHYS